MFPRINIDSVKGDIEKIFLSERLAQGEYQDLFYDHLTSLIKFRLLSEKNDVDELKLTFKNYLGLEQFSFENSKMAENEEPLEVDWDLVDDGKDILKKQIEKLLKNEAKSDFLKPIVKFTIDSYENWLIYTQLHPSSISNPWLPTNHILHNGYLHLVSDNREVIDNYSKKVYYEVEEENRGNLGVIAKSSKERSFSGFLVDNRLNTQGLVYEYLKREAKGKSFAKNRNKIAEFLKSQGRTMGDNDIRNRIMIPLKRAGLIGSSTSGFYYINSQEDLIQTYIHHKEKADGIQTTLRMYENTAKKLSINNFEELIKERMRSHY